MHKIILILVTLLGSGCAKEAPPTPISEPELPLKQVILPLPELIAIGGLPEGFQWSYSDGPDFYLYRATREEVSVGIYFGTHSRFEPKMENESAVILPFATVTAEWISRIGDRGQITWEALIPYKHAEGFSDLKLHATIWAPTSEKAELIATALKDLRFDQITYEERKRESKQ